MLTRKQKEKIVEQESKQLEESKTLIFTDFTGLSANEANILRKSLREFGAKYRVIKKRLLGIIFKNHAIEVNSKDLQGQVGVVFSPEELPETAGKVFKFFKEHAEKFKVLGGVEVQKKKIISKEEVEMIGNLPPREVLLGQLVYVLGSPIRSFMFILNERGKKLE